MNNILNKILLLTLLLCLSYCENENLWEVASSNISEEKVTFGSNNIYTYDENYPVVGVYQGQASLFDEETYLTYFEFMNDYENYTRVETATCYVYYTSLNFLVKMSYTYNSEEKSIIFGEIASFTSFGSNTIINSAPFPAISSYTDIEVDSTSLTGSYKAIFGDSGDNNSIVKIVLERLSIPFPKSPQNSSTLINIKFSNSNLKNKTVLAFATYFENNNGGGSPDAGTGIAKLNSKGNGLAKIYVPNSAFTEGDTIQLEVMYGDIPRNTYWNMENGPPFVYYGGYINENWNGTIEADRTPYSLSKGTEVTVLAEYVLPVSSFQDNSTETEDY